MARPGTTLVSDAAIALKAAIATAVPDDQNAEALGASRVLDFGAEVTTGPVVVVGNPTLTWDSFGNGPDSASFPVFVVLDASDRATERLWSLVPIVATTIGEASNGVVTRAEPGVFNAGTSQLPCYQLSVDYPL